MVHSVPNIKFNRARSLPEVILIADEANRKQVLSRIKKLPATSAVIVRDYGHPKRREWAKTLVGVCKKQKIPVLIANDPQMAMDLGADGCHFPQYRLSQVWQWRYKNPLWLISGAVHSRLGACLANVYPLSFILVSPVLKTQSHPLAIPLGLQGLRAIIRVSCHPVVALGGIKQEYSKEMRSCGACAVAWVRG